MHSQKIYSNRNRSMREKNNKGIATSRKGRKEIYTPVSQFTVPTRGMESVYRVFVWRPLENFDKDYIHSPTGLLQLVLGWSKATLCA